MNTPYPEQEIVAELIRRTELDALQWFAKQTKAGVEYLTVHGKRDIIITPSYHLYVDGFNITSAPDLILAVRAQQKRKKQAVIIDLHSSLGLTPL